ncbi:hypothetical protein AVEN_52598-1 [Araneus ventricosus]|uniref:Uncharacterized protein n=1 Tax=Araneus ventricosus TaxID=182803 RepID=A0A4Y2END6_ARAVE|nr:hypothetical protein AVEN_52598-1 [Araneus ventricosus]
MTFEILPHIQTMNSGVHIQQLAKSSERVLPSTFSYTYTIFSVPLCIPKRSSRIEKEAAKHGAGVFLLPNSHVISYNMARFVFRSKVEPRKTELIGADLCSDS